MRVLDEGDWAEYRDVRLAALQESPEAFVATYEEESALDEEAWRDRMRRSRRLVAASGGTVVGVVSVGRTGQEEDNAGELFGLWVAPAARAPASRAQLVQAGADAGPRRRPQPPRLLGRHRERRAPSPSPAASASAPPTPAVRCAWSARRTARRRSRWCSRSRTTAPGPDSARA